MTNPEKDETGKQANNFAKYTGMAFQMLATIGLFTFIGYKIDENQEHHQSTYAALLGFFRCDCFFIYGSKVANEEWKIGNSASFYYLCGKQNILSLTRFILSYFLFTLVIAGVVIGLPYIFPSTPLLINKFWVVFCFIVGITFIAYLVAYMGIKRKPEMGVMAIMASIALKMLFSMAFVLIYVLKTPVSSMLFVLNFFSLYFLFSGFEIYALLCNLRHSIKK